MASPKYISLGFLVLICLRFSLAHRVLIDSLDDHKPKQSHLNTQPISTLAGGGGGGSHSGVGYGAGGGIGGGHGGGGGDGGGWGSYGNCGGSGYPSYGGPTYGPPFYGPTNPGFGPGFPAFGCGCPCSCGQRGTGAHNEPKSSEAVKADDEAHEAHSHGFAKRTSELDSPPLVVDQVAHKADNLGSFGFAKKASEAYYPPPMDNIIN